MHYQCTLPLLYNHEFGVFASRLQGTMSRNILFWILFHKKHFGHFAETWKIFWNGWSMGSEKLRHYWLVFYHFGQHLLLLIALKCFGMPLAFLAHMMPFPLTFGHLACEGCYVMKESILFCPNCIAVPSLSIMFWGKIL